MPDDTLPTPRPIPPALSSPAILLWEALLSAYSPAGTKSAAASAEARGRARLMAARLLSACADAGMSPPAIHVLQDMAASAAATGGTDASRELLAQCTQAVSHLNPQALAQLLGKAAP